MDRFQSRDAVPLPRYSRRRMLRDAALFASALAGTRGLAQGRGGRPLWSLDLDGDGVISGADRRLLARATELARGWEPLAADRWQPALDFLGEGRTGPDALRQFDRLRPALDTKLPPRPITACWHYGWYTPGRRRRESTTVRYVGGDYLSTSRRTEFEFNALKEEFGIDADILSWIDRRPVLKAYERAYLEAGNRDRRRFGLLYESIINLGAEGRIDLRPDGAAALKLAQDFRRMGQWLRGAVGADGPGLLRVDGRPVVYVFGSHAFGLRDQDLPAVTAALLRARREFAKAFGQHPYLIGDESIFPGDPGVELNRRVRAQSFDAVTRYHHYDARLVGALGSGSDIRMDAAYRRRIRNLEETNEQGFRRVSNLATGAPVLVVPSAAAGFAKRGLPGLLASRADYAALLEDVLELTYAHLRARHADRLYSSALEAPLVLVGSWNEEFEGHALMPAARNEAVAGRRQHGYDWLLALKSVFGVSRPASG